MDNDPYPKITEEFNIFTKTVATLAENVNKACRNLKGKLSPSGEIDTGGTTFTGDGRVIRDYENALEELKGFIQNQSAGHLHNENLKRKIDGETHAIRGLEVQLVHGEDSNEHLITGVVVRGLISIEPADGNEAPNYSSKSSSSRVPPPTA